MTHLWLYCVVAFRYVDDDLVPIWMNVIFFAIGLLSIAILILDITISTLINSYWLKYIIYLFFSTDNDVFPLTFFWRIRPHVLNIDKHTQYSSRINSHKLPLSLLDILHKYDWGYKPSINVIKKTNALRALVNEYLSSTVGSEMSLLNKVVWMTGRLLSQ